MSLSGYAAELATRAGIGELAVSLTHEEGIAGAVVVALCQEEPSEDAGVRVGGSPLMDEKIRSILTEHGRFPIDVATIGDDEDLFGRDDLPRQRQRHARSRRGVRHGVPGEHAEQEHLRIRYGNPDRVGRVDGFLVQRADGGAAPHRENAPG